jgi:hypothetical protein
MDLPVVQSTDDLATTRRSLHAVAEHILAGPQHRPAGTVRLAVTADGFGTVALTGDPSRLEVRGTTLVGSRPGGRIEVPLAGTIAELAKAVGVEPGAPEGVYDDGSGADASTRVEVDAAAAAVILRALAMGDAALRDLAVRHRADDPPTPVLWPEHFDVGIDLDEVNFGVSPGDGLIGEPYAYIGPRQRRVGAFWDQPFGAARRLSDLADSAALAAFFEAGRDAAATDPVA